MKPATRRRGRMFWLDRIEDETGISGTGKIADGFVSEDGTVAMRWLTAHRSWCIYSDMAEVEAIHGHNGKTVIRWAVLPRPKQRAGKGKK